MDGSTAPDAAGRETGARAGARLGRSITERFDEVAAANRSRVAIRTPRGEIRYGELAAFSNRIAAALGKRLARRGVAAPIPIAVLLPQGIAAIAAQLGILKAGAFYVPLDPRHPPAHLSETVEHSGAHLVVTNSKLGALAERVCGDARALVDIDGISRWAPSRAPKPGAADSLAYLYYTSGSTGRPKGVADTHRNVLHNIHRYTCSLRIVGEDRLSLVQSPAFSGVVSSTYAALLNGAMLCPYDLHEDGPLGLADWLAESRVTIYHSVPTLFRKLVAERRYLPALRVVRLEGDRALWSDAALFQANCPPTAVLVNGLGTTETGIVRQFFVSCDTQIEEGLL
ncbi:MAG TPA: AMP-binding protein, partial [Casimicrobiaceae bacterium]|nr:AMP-binding protein [Casimicrobiaceae bacterium]